MKTAYTISQAQNLHGERHEPAATTKAATLSERISGSLRLRNGILTATIHAGANDTFSRPPAVKLPFGISTCYTSVNYKDITSERFFDYMIDSGALFAWFFHYMSVGNNAATQLLPSPEQRTHIHHKILEYRSTNPIFTIEFQNDAEYVGGCIAGGRSYLHIKAKGDVEPCVFIHYSNCNIHDTSLLDALRSPLFMAYHNNQPFNENMLRPCPMLENPEALRAMVKSTGAVNTDYESPESVDHLCDKTTPYAENWKGAADKLWSETCTRCGKRG